MSAVVSVYDSLFVFLWLKCRISMFIKIKKFERIVKPDFVVVVVVVVLLLEFLCYDSLRTLRTLDRTLYTSALVQKCLDSSVPRHLSTPNCVVSLGCEINTAKIV